MSDDPDKPVDLWPYHEADVLDRAFRNMRRKAAEERERQFDGLEVERGTVFVDDDGNEVGYLMPVANPEDQDE